MSSLNSGSAREIAPGRLAGFEDAGDLDVTPAMPKLPPRRTTPPSAGPALGTTPARPIDARRSTDVPPARQTGRSLTGTPSRGTGGEAPGLKGPEDRVRPSNVHIPVDMMGRVEEECKDKGLSHGELIIVAVERAHPRLHDLIHPTALAGGNLFASRRSRAARTADGRLTPLNYRLRESDFQTLDVLVENFGASSRGHLITVSLKDYFSDAAQ